MRTFCFVVLVLASVAATAAHPRPAWMVFSYYPDLSDPVIVPTQDFGAYGSVDAKYDGVSIGDLLTLSQTAKRSEMAAVIQANPGYEFCSASAKEVTAAGSRHWVLRYNDRDETYDFQMQAFGGSFENEYSSWAQVRIGLTAVPKGRALLPGMKRTSPLQIDCDRKSFGDQDLHVRQTMTMNYWAQTMIVVDLKKYGDPDQQHCVSVTARYRDELEAEANAHPDMFAKPGAAPLHDVKAALMREMASIPNCSLIPDPGVPKKQAPLSDDVELITKWPPF